MLDFIDKAFNQVPFPIKMRVVFSPRLSAVTTFGNDHFFACPPDFLHKRLRVVAFIGNQTIKHDVFN